MRETMVQKKNIAIRKARQEAKDEVDDRTPEVQVLKTFKNLNQALV
jgi:hypothetical protein